MDICPNPLSPRWNTRSRLLYIILIITSFFLILHRYDLAVPGTRFSTPQPLPLNRDTFWSRRPQQHPVHDLRSLPSPRSRSLPKIQAKFAKETSPQRAERLSRLEAVKSNFTHAWNGYKAHAWLRDEVTPISAQAHDPFGGWAATLVDSLDTLWMMDMKTEFAGAVAAVANIDFSKCFNDEINLFETTIRHLGGMMAAYELSDGRYLVLLEKAAELGDMLYYAFDTPNRMPITRWNFKKAAAGTAQEASDNMLIAEIASLTLEFTKLSQLTGDPKWYDAVQRIMDLLEAQQMSTKLPGMWPVVVNARTTTFTEHGGFTIGGMADSTYEYLPKQYLLLAGGSQQYQKMYESAYEAINRNIFYRMTTPNGHTMLFPGDCDSDGQTPTNQLRTEPRAQHLSCFAGGMVALGAKAFERPEQMQVARDLVEGCLWSYENMPNGVMPEIMHTSICANKDHCTWDEQTWRAEIEHQHSEVDNPEQLFMPTGSLPKGITKIDDSRYILRPETIESVFILYRLTGDPMLPDRAWNMFNSIIKLTKTDVAHAGLDDCCSSSPKNQDRMESFWMAETLKYFYLIFSEPNLVSLDEWVLNTEAHPLRRPR